MDRLTATIKLPPEGVFMSCTEEQLAEIKRADKVSPRKIYRRLQAYEDTGLTPEDIAQLQALCNMRSEQHAKLMVENERLKKLLDQIAFIAGKGG